MCDWNVSFLWSFLGIILRLIQQAKGYYYKDINMITTGNLSFHLKKMLEHLLQ